MTRIEVAESADALSHMVAEHFVRLTADAIGERARCAVALSGGSTPKAVYRMLATEPYRSQAQWDRIHFFWGDERHVPPDHAESNYRMAMDAMLSKVPVTDSQIHRMHGEVADADRAAQDYEDEIRGFFGGDRLPVFDLIHLGLGTDGHTASLFPGSAALDERRRLCVANWVARLAGYRITLTLPVLNAARAGVFIVSGGEKASIVAQVLRDARATPASPLPANLVQPADGDLRWMLDRAAAAELS
jgi:6-phosphogluconolactonase